MQSEQCDQIWQKPRPKQREKGQGTSSTRSQALAVEGVRAEETLQPGRGNGAKTGFRTHP